MAHTIRDVVHEPWSFAKKTEKGNCTICAQSCQRQDKYVLIIIYVIKFVMLSSACENIRELTNLRVTRVILQRKGVLKVFRQCTFWFVKDMYLHFGKFYFRHLQCNYSTAEVST